MAWFEDLGIIPILTALAVAGGAVAWFLHRRNRKSLFAHRLGSLGLAPKRVDFVVQRTTEVERDRFLRSNQPYVGLGRLLDGLRVKGTWWDRASLDAFLWGVDEARQRQLLREERGGDIRPLEVITLKIRGQEPVEMLTLSLREHRLLALQINGDRIRSGSDLRWSRAGNLEYAKVDSVDPQAMRLLWISCRRGLSWEERRTDYRAVANIEARMLHPGSTPDLLARQIRSEDLKRRQKAMRDLKRLCGEDGIGVKILDLSRHGAKVRPMKDVEFDTSVTWLVLVPAWGLEAPVLLLPTRVTRKASDATFGLEFSQLDREVAAGLSQWSLALQRLAREREDPASTLVLDHEALG